MGYEEKTVDAYHICSDYDGKIKARKFLFLNWKVRGTCSKQDHCRNAKRCYGCGKAGHHCIGYTWGALSVREYKIKCRKGEILRVL